MIGMPCRPYRVLFVKQTGCKRRRNSINWCMKEWKPVYILPVDYAFQGMHFLDMNFFDFIVETYEQHIDPMEDEQEKELDNESSKERQHGHKQNTHCDYLSSHPKYESHLRIQHTDHHKNIPNIIGLWFPKRDDVHEDNNFYYASILALLKPWRDMRTLKDVGQTWEEGFNDFLQEASQQIREVVAGMQYYYKSKKMAENRLPMSAEDEEMEINNNEDDSCKSKMDDALSTGPVVGCDDLEENVC